MIGRDDGYRAAAIDAIADRHFEAAGDAYSRAAWSVLAEPREGHDPFSIDERGWVGGGVHYLVLAALCYRVAGAEARATRRSVEGVSVARDLASQTPRAVQQACFTEFVGDLRVAGGLDGATEAYDKAIEAYHKVGNELEQPQRWATTPLFEAAAAAIKQTARGPANGEIAVTWEDLHGSDPGNPGAFLAARPQYKRQHFPAAVERVLETGVLAAPRGSTEYDTTHHACPHCGSTDVNWVGNATLCLRCSRPTAEQ